MIGQWVKIRTRDHTVQKSYSTPSESSRVFPPELSFFDRKTSEALEQITKQQPTVFIKPGMRQIPYMMLENNFRLFVKGSKCFFGMI
jgi:hypothetical protein